MSQRMKPCAWAGALAMASLGGAMAVEARQAKPTIAVFSGQNATIQNGLPLITSNKAREKYGLPLRTDEQGRALRFDLLRPQRLAAPVTVYIEAFSAHPLEKDATELYAPPDGYVNRRTGAFNRQRQGPDDVPVYEATLRPSDGLYMLPYMARQADGGAWDGYCTSANAATEQCRQNYYPDASRTFEEVDRFFENAFSSLADFDFYRAVPPAGYRKGLLASERTDVGSGDIPREIWGEHFFPSGSHREEPARFELARITNMAQRAMSSGKYAGGIWMAGSSQIEETVYWLNLLVDTRVPIVGNASQSGHGVLGNDGNRNMVSSVEYILSGVWKDASGLDRIGAVMVQERRAIAAREVQKIAARPGGYVPTGGHGGVVASIDPTRLTSLPIHKHTHTSEVNVTRLPASVQGVRRAGNRIDTMPVAIKDGNGDLLPTAIPRVGIVKYATFGGDDYADDPLDEVEISARIDRNLTGFPLAGFVVEANEPYGNVHESLQLALERAAVRRMPVVRVGRGNTEDFTSRSRFMLGGGNLTATKARLLLMACLMKFGSLPVPADPERPTAAELKALEAKMVQYQAVFDLH
jgi:L-asparaginase